MMLSICPSVRLFVSLSPETRLRSGRHQGCHTRFLPVKNSLRKKLPAKFMVATAA